MNDNNINSVDELISNAIKEVKTLASSDTIVGSPIVSPSGTIIIPISKVSVGYVVGGGQYATFNKKMPYPTCGGSGGGVSVVPIGFIIETDDNVKFIDISNKSEYQTVLNIVNTFIDKVLKDKENQNENENIKQ